MYHGYRNKSKMCCLGSRAGVIRDFGDAGNVLKKFWEGTGGRGVNLRDFKSDGEVLREFWKVLDAWGFLVIDFRECR